MDIINQNSNDATATTQVATEDKSPDKLVGLTTELLDNFSDTGDIDPVEAESLKKVKVEQKHKDAFLKAIVENTRYREEVELFNGSVHATIRSRTAEETDAIMAYIRHVAVTGGGLSDYEYSSRMRTMMLTAQVERINDTEYPELRAPLFAVETKNGKTPPAWVEDLEIWGKKSDALVAALSAAVSEFESRYWLMIRESNNVNFWKPGTSTGQ